MAALPVAIWSTALLAAVLASDPVPDQARTDPAKAVPGAIQDGLRWLARHQNPDGSWSAATLHERCTSDPPCFEKSLERNTHYAEGVTGLAVLCFLRAGYAPGSKVELKDGEKSYVAGDVVEHGLAWLCARQNEDGSFTPRRPFLYNEAMATLAVAEAAGRTRDAKWKVPAQKAIDLLEDAQRRNPLGKGSWGWRYETRREVESPVAAKNARGEVVDPYQSDTSITAWCVAALHAGQAAGLKVKPESMSGALDFCRFVTAADGRVGYLHPEQAGMSVAGPFDKEFTYHSATMAAAAICIRTYAGRNPDDLMLRKSLDPIVADAPGATEGMKSVDYYYWYYGSLALYLVDGPESAKRTGKYWTPWRKALTASVLELQDHGQGSCGDGGWLHCDRWSLYSGYGPLVATTLSLLALEVPSSKP